MHENPHNTANQNVLWADPKLMMQMGPIVFSASGRPGAMIWGCSTLFPQLWSVTPPPIISLILDNKREHTTYILHKANNCQHTCLVHCIVIITANTHLMYYIRIKTANTRLMYCIRLITDKIHLMYCIRLITGIIHVMYCTR